MPYDCFISYASADLKFAEQLHGKLVEQDFTVWFDRARLSPGCNWHSEIEEGCENSRIVLPILTPRWKLSEWTRFETYGAEAVVPLILEGRRADVFTPPLERFQAEAVTTSSLDQASWPRLFATLRRLLTQPVPHKQDRLVHLHYRVNDHFVGRDLDLIRIHEELHRNPRAVLTQGRVRAITAMGGVGKTTLARHYAEKFWRCYAQILWVDARKGLEPEFAILHDLLFPDRRDIGLKVADKAKQAIHELSSPLTRLLIIDNAEDEHATTAWIPKTGGCQTLITSRFSGWSGAVKTLHLFVLEKGPAVNFLQSRADRIARELEHADCEVLAERLGYLPLALEQAAAYIKKLHFSFTEYLRIYERATSELLAQQALGSTEYPDSVITSLQPSIERIGPGALTILRLAASIAATPVHWRLFVANPDLVLNRVALLAKPKTFSPPANFEFWLLNEIAALVDYSIVDFDGQTLSLHPLLLTVQFETQSVEDRRRNWSDAATLMAAAAPAATWKIDCREKWTLENDKKWERLTPQVDRLLELQQRIPELPSNPAFELLAVDTYATQRSYPRAIALCRALCNRLATSTDQSEKWLIEAKDSLASLLKQSDLIQEALEEFRSLHALRVKTQGEDAPAAMRALHNVACLMELLGDTPGAETLMREVLSRRKRLLGDNHYDTEISVHDLGWLLNNHAEKLNEAEPLFRHALERWKATLGLGNPDTRDAATNLATLLRNKGDFTQALQVQRDLVEGTSQVLGPDHLACFELMHNLALFQWNIGQYVESHATIKRVVEGYRRYLPPNHRDMLTAIQDLGTIFSKLGNHAEAERLLREALAGYEATQENDSDDIVRSVGNLALVLDILGQTNEADILRLRSLQANERKRGAEHPDTLAGWNQRGHSLRKRGAADEAEPIERKVSATTAKILGETHNLTIHRRNNLVLTLIMLGKLEEARQILAANWRLNAPPHANITPRIAFLRHLIALLESQPDTPFLGQLKTLLTGPELPVASDVAVPWDIAYFIEFLKPKLGEHHAELLTALSPR